MHVYRHAELQTVGCGASRSGDNSKDGCSIGQDGQVQDKKAIIMKAGRGADDCLYVGQVAEKR